IRPEHRRRQNQKSIDLRLRSSEKRAIKVGRTAYLQNPQVELEKRGRLLDCLELIRAGGRIPQRGHAGKTRGGLLQELEPLRPKLGEIEKEPGDVATRPREAGNQAGCDRVRLQIVRDAVNDAGAGSPRWHR